MGRVPVQGPVKSFFGATGKSDCRRESGVGLLQ